MNVAFGVLAGMFISAVVAIAIPYGRIPDICIYLPEFIGGGVAGYVAGRRGWLAGLIVGLVQAGFAWYILKAIAAPVEARTHHQLSLSATDIFHIIVTSVPVGALAGWAGQCLKSFLAHPEGKAQ